MFIISDSVWLLYICLELKISAWSTKSNALLKMHTQLSLGHHLSCVHRRKRQHCNLLDLNIFKGYHLDIRRIIFLDKLATKTDQIRVKKIRRFVPSLYYGNIFSPLWPKTIFGVLSKIHFRQYVCSPCFSLHVIGTRQNFVACPCKYYFPKSFNLFIFIDFIHWRNK
jgi:hypothetical protein